MRAASEPGGWFADLANEEERTEAYPWQPFLQDGDSCYPLSVWFRTKEECEAFISRRVADAGVLP